MLNYSKKISSRSSFYRLIAATLTMGGVSLSMPLIASAQTATAAGTSIINRATGTYEDPSQPGVQINTTSNTVTVTVAEVAGITAVANGIVDSTPLTPVLPTDTLTYSFLITNVGNDTTRVFIPAPILTGPAAFTGVNTFDIDANGDGTFETLGTTLVAAQAALLSPGGRIRVNVPVLVDVAATSGAPIVVRLGDTPPNNNTAGTQNQPSTALATDLRTVDGVTPGDVGETVGAPTNGEREASVVAQILVGANPQAFAAVLKTQGAYFNNGTPAVFTDDLQTYNLTLRVDNAAPTGASPSLTPADLTGTPTNVNGVVANRVLVSDAIPASTVLNAAPSAPAGWTVVYTTSVNTIDANAALWTTTAPAFPAPTIIRVGFVNNGPITRGTTVTGFSFQVVTSGLPAAAGGTIYNIAQLFGQSVGGTTVVYDESGDITPSNFNNDGTVGPGPNTNPVTPKGVANPATDGIDNLGNNTGTGAGGEDNALILVPPGTLLNGPLNAPTAVGPTSNNDDFTNKSTTVPPNTNPGTLIDPPSLTFTNTLNAPPGTTLTNVLLRPVAPAVAADLPTGTTATITFGAQTAIYTYNGTIFTFTGGTSIQIPTIPANSSVNYTVAIDLPAGTALSTDSGNGYPVPILAFADTNLDGLLTVGEPNNTTIDRVYTGFLRLLKTSQVLQGAGPTVIGADGTLSANAKTPSPGNILRYVLTYSNISTPPVGVGNIILDATNVVITDSGILNTLAFPTAPNGNNWGQDYNINGVIDTSHVIGSAIDSGTGSVITFFSTTTGLTPTTEQSGTTPATDITRYVNTLSVPVTPGSAARTFEFQRRLN